MEETQIRSQCVKPEDQFDDISQMSSFAIITKKMQDNQELSGLHSMGFIYNKVAKDMEGQNKLVICKSLQQKIILLQAMLDENLNQENLSNKVKKNIYKKI